MEVDHTSEIIQASVYKAHQRQRRSASLPSTSLPPEILSFIFELVRDRYTWFDPGNYDSWIPAVTHVCAAWREVALQTPQLWTFASLYPLEWGNEVLRRTKGAPLDVSVCGKLFGDDLNTMNEGISLMKAAFSELDRVRSIDLSLPAQQPDTVLKTLSELVRPSSMPILESIAIRSPFRACRVLDGMFVTDDSAPRLKRLILGDCLLDLSTPRFQRLCYLELESTLSPATRITNLRSFCIALGEMHDLVELKLSDVLPEHVDEDTLQVMIFNPIQLPSLRRIEVLETCVPLPIFRCTRAPRLVYAYISLYDFLGYEDVSDNLEEIYKFAAFGASAADDEATEFHLHIEESGESRSMGLTQATGNKDTSKTLRFHFESDSDYGFWSIIPISLISSFSLRVGFMVDIPDEATTYLISLAQSESLSTLEVPHTLLLNRELMAQLSHFPALSELIFRSFPRDEESVIQLLAWLGFRERFGYRRLKELNMNGWGNGINPAIIHLLGQSVDSFTTSLSERQMQIFRSQHLGHLD